MSKIQIRDLILQDSEARQKWRLVVDDLVRSPSENQRIKQLLEDSKYEQAVLESLVVFYDATEDDDNAAESGARKRTNGSMEVGLDLVRILKGKELNELADKILNCFKDNSWLQKHVKDPTAAYLMKLISYMDTSRISVALLEQMVPDASRCITILELMGLVKENDGKVRVTKPEPNLVLTKEDEKEELQIIETIVRVLEQQLTKPTDPKLTEESAQHVVKLLPHFLAHKEFVQDSFIFLLQACIQIQAFQEHPAMISFPQQIVPVYASEFGENHEYTLEMKRRVGEGNLRSSANDFARGLHFAARLQFGKAIEILEPLLPVAIAKHGQHSNVTLLIRDSLARAYNGTGQHTVLALQLANENLEYATEILEEDHKLVTMFHLTKGIVLFTSARFTDAIPILEHVVQSFESGHEASQIARQLLVIAFKTMGDEAKADEVHRQMDSAGAGQTSQILQALKPLLDEALREARPSPVHANPTAAAVNPTPATSAGTGGRAHANPARMAQNGAVDVDGVGHSPNDNDGKQLQTLEGHRKSQNKKSGCAMCQLL